MSTALCISERHFMRLGSIKHTFGMQGPPPPQPKASRLPKCTEPSYPHHLTPSTADNPILFLQCSSRARSSPRNALSVLLQRNVLLKHLYEASVLSLIHAVQAAALGRRFAPSEKAALPWAAIAATGEIFREEHVGDYEHAAEAADIAPSGFDGPGTPGGGPCHLAVPHKCVLRTSACP
jgi:hypothetical protein